MNLTAGEIVLLDEINSLKQKIMELEYQLKNKDEERILCAAIWYKDLPLKKEEWIRTRGISPYDISEGIVLCGWRHSCIIAQMNALTGLRQYEITEVQGFLTSKNRFVNREEAMELFRLEKGGDVKTLHKNQLFSEDLY